MDWEIFEQSAVAKCIVVEASLKRRLAELQQVKADGLALTADVKRLSGDIDVVSYGESTLFMSQATLGDAYQRALLLRHDVEIAVADSLVSGQMDLNKVFPPYDFQLDAHNVVHAEQFGRASLVRASTPPWLMVPPGQLALDVPIKIAVLGQEAKAALVVTMQILRAPGQPSWQRTFAMGLGRGAALCPPEVIKALFSGKTIDGRVREEASRQIAKVEPFEVDASFIDTLFGGCFLYGASVTDNVSFFGVVRHRPRGYLPPLGPLPIWASAGTKFHQSLLATVVLSRAPSGAWLTHFDSDVGAQVFRFGIAMEKAKSKGGDLFRVTVRVRVTGEFILSLRAGQPNRLEVSSIQQGNLQIDRVHVEKEIFNIKVGAPGIDELIDSLATAIAQELAGDLGNYSTNFTEFVPNCMRIATEVLPGAMALYLSKA